MKTQKKARYKYKKPQEDFKGFSVSQYCDKLTLKYTYDSRHLILAALDLLTYNQKVTKESIIKTLRDTLYSKGYEYFDNNINYQLSDDLSQLSDTLQLAHDTVRELFPQYFDISNAEHFIKEAL